MDNKKNTILLTVIAVATLLVAVVGATFAYFTAQGGSTVTKNITVTTGEAGQGTFTVNSAINIYADATTFAENAGNREGSTTGTAYFKAPTQPEGATLDAKDLRYCYTVAVNITANDFEYTVNESTPELTLNVTKNSTAVIDTMDITTKTGNINVPTEANGNVTIHKLQTTAGQEVTDNWEAKVTLINLSTDQNDNTGKNLTGTLTFAKATCQD